MPDIFGGHERREERRDKRHGRRLVRSGDEFTSDELARGEVDLYQPDSSGPEPDRGGTEPWGTDNPTSEMAMRHHEYLEFIAERERQDPDTYINERMGDHGDNS